MILPHFELCQFFNASQNTKFLNIEGEREKEESNISLFIMYWNMYFLGQGSLNEPVTHMQTLSVW